VILSSLTLPSVRVRLGMTRLGRVAPAFSSLPSALSPPSPPLELFVLELPALKGDTGEWPCGNEIRCQPFLLSLFASSWSTSISVSSSLIDGGGGLRGSPGDEREVLKGTLRYWASGEAGLAGDAAVRSLLLIVDWRRGGIAVWFKIETGKEMRNDES
jgi:hypothetical protein